jgi:hypothetical protein
MPLSPQQRRFLHTRNHPSVQGVKQREAAAYVTRLNNRIQLLQEQQVARDHRASLHEQRNFYPRRNRRLPYLAAYFTQPSEKELKPLPKQSNKMPEDVSMDATAGGNNASTIETVLETLWAPETLNYVPGSTSELEQNLKLSGIKLRRELLMSAQKDFDSWATLMIPPSNHEASRTLTQMLLHLPTLTQMSFWLMEKYLFPTIKLMDYCRKKGMQTFPGGIEVMVLYSFYLQGQVYPRDRTLQDLETLKATTLTADHELLQQIRSEVAHADTVSSQMRNTLIALQKACVLPEYDDLMMQGQDGMLKRQDTIDRLIAIYDLQHQVHYAVTKHQSSQLTMFAHLAQKQVVEVLELNLRLLDSYEQTDIKFQEAISKPIAESQPPCIRT